MSIGVQRERERSNVSTQCTPERFFFSNISDKDAFIGKHTINSRSLDSPPNGLKYPPACKKIELPMAKAFGMKWHQNSIFFLKSLSFMPNLMTDTKYTLNEQLYSIEPATPI